MVWAQCYAGLLIHLVERKMKGSEWIGNGGERRQLRSAYAGEKERTRMRRFYPILTYVEGFSRSSEGVCALRTFVRAMKRQQQLRVVVVGL